MSKDQRLAYVQIADRVREELVSTYSVHALGCGAYLATARCVTIPRD